MRKKINTEWFVEPLDAHTNEVIAKNLASLNQISENFALESTEGKEVSVFQVEGYPFIARLYRDKSNFLLKFKVYTRQGKHNPLRLWLYDEPKPRKKLRLKKT